MQNIWNASFESSDEKNACKIKKWWWWSSSDDGV